METDLGEAARTADADILRPGLIGDGTSTVAFEVFDAGTDQVGAVAAVSDLDLRFEGNDAVASTPVGQTDRNRGQACLFGVNCQRCLVLVAPLALPDASVVSAYSQSLQASGGAVPFTLVVSGGALPAGLMLATDGTLSGTPTAEGPFTFTVTATDAAACSGSRLYAITVNGAAAPGGGGAFVPPERVAARCERRLARNVGRLTSAFGKCHIKAAQNAFDARPFDEEACETVAESKYEVANTRLPVTCPACLAAAQGAIQAQVESTLDASNGDVYCAGTTPLGGDDSGFVPPHAAAATCEKRLASRVAKLLSALTKCNVKIAERAFRARFFDAAACEGVARASYDRALAKLVPVCPACVDANKTTIRDDTETLVDELSARVYCAGTTPLAF